MTISEHLRPTAKYWLYFLRGYPNRQHPVQLPRTIEKCVASVLLALSDISLTIPINRLHANTLRQWDILEKRLSTPGQNYIALADRPTLADLSYFPFAMPWMFKFLGVEVKDWPQIERWGTRMLARPAIQLIMENAPRIGHEK